MFQTLCKTAQFHLSEMTYKNEREGVPYLGSDEEVLSPDHAIVEELLQSNTNLLQEHAELLLVICL